jgi:hypothetical protein
VSCGEHPERAAVVDGRMEWAEYLSTSSIKTTQGEILLASVKTARAYFSPSPNHFEPIDDIEQSVG